MHNDIYRSILFWIEGNICNGNTIDALSKYTGYSRRTLETSFLKTYNISLGEYMFRRRMTRAAVMLRLAGLSITEVAMLLNYSSPANFTRAFRRYFGLTPENYRRQIVWDSNKLQIPLFYMCPEFSSEKLLITSTAYIYGEKFQYHANYTDTYDNSFIENLKPRMVSLSSNHFESLWMSTTLSVPDKIADRREGRVLIDTVVGYSTLKEKENSVIMPAGLYAMLHFSGSWSEYMIFSRLAYTFCLVRNNWRWIGDSSFINICSWDFINDYISCKLYFLIDEN